MKILFYISSMQGGGAQRVLCSLANYFCRKEDFDVSIVTNLSLPIAYQLEKKIKLVDLESGIKYKTGILHFLCCLYSILRIYKKTSPDIVISFQRGMNGMVLLALFLAKAKIICSEHNYFQRKYGVVEDTLMKLLYWRANAITVLTRHDLKICKKMKKNNFIYMPNPLQIISDYKCNREKQVLAAGHIDRWKIKGFDLLLEAWGMICHKYPKWKLAIAGTGKEKSINLLRDYSNSYNCINVEFLGFRKDIASIMQESSIFVLSSRFEGLPMALLEAMQAGCCCISFDCETGPNEIINNDEDGVLVPAQDVKKLALALDKMIANHELQVKFSTQARLSVQKKYSEEYVMNRWKILLSKLS